MLSHIHISASDPIKIIHRSILATFDLPYLFSDFCQSRPTRSQGTGQIVIEAIDYLAAGLILGGVVLLNRRDTAAKS